VNRRANLPDHAAETDERGLPITQVGIRGLRWPVQVMDPEREAQPTVATLDLSVGLPADQKGTHMSRLVECLEASGGELSLLTLPALLADLQRRLHAEDVFVTARFPYFIRKHAPVSGVASWLDVDCVFEASRHGDQVGFTLHVTVPVTSLCPCSKAISAYGAHNQRSEVQVAVTAERMVWIEEVVEAIEGVASSPVFALLKREDEKHVTELAYDNPRFVEDLVREAALALQDLEGVTAVRVIADNQESIHNHSAWARLDWHRDGAPERVRTAVPDVLIPEPEAFGTWMKRRRAGMRLSQQELAEALGVSASWVCKVEGGEKQLSTEALGRLAELVGADPVSVQLKAGVVPDALLARIAADPEGFRDWAGA
jgi:GTP cyclohydrolase I